MEMNIKTSRIITLLAAASAVAAVLGSCAKEAATENNASEKRFFDSWIRLNHPSAQRTTLGAYIVDDQPGTGETVTGEDTFILARYTVTDLEGNITSTTSEELAKQLGTWARSKYYGDQVLLNNTSYTEAGLLDIIKGMKVGGTRRGVIPGWLNVKTGYDTAEEYLKNCSGENAVYTITITGKTDDIYALEVEQLEKFTDEYMDGVDSTMYGYYCKQLVAPSDTTEIPVDTTYYINYTGRLLNGQVFDTTIKDTAKVYGIYSESKTYKPIQVNMSSEYTEITIGSDNDSNGVTGSTVVDGFSYTLSKLRKYQKVICAFYSVYGYGYSGMGAAIPKYAPLSFTIEYVDKPEN